MNAPSFGQSRSSEDERLAEGIEDISRRRRLFTYLFIGWAPAAVVTRVATGSDTLALIMGMGLALLAMAAFAAVLSSRCPRCGELFHQHASKWWRSYGTFFSIRCLNCGLQLRNTRY
jgi:hypothetical protein